MKSVQKTVTEYIEKRAEKEGVQIMDSRTWANMGTWRVINEDGEVSSLKYDFQDDYVRFGPFGDGNSFRYQGQFHLIMKFLNVFIEQSK